VNQEKDSFGMGEEGVQNAYQNMPSAAHFFPAKSAQIIRNECGGPPKRMGFTNHLSGVNEASCRRIRAHSTTLSIPSGLVEMSNRIKSGLSSLAFSMASKPLTASPHTANPEQLSSRARTAARMAAWSSTMRMESKRRASVSSKAAS
jgi:hypothetical protein